MKRLLLLVSISLVFAFNSMGQRNLAYLGVATQSGGGSAAYGPANYNDSIITAGPSITPWGWVSGGGWIEYTWTTPVSFQDIVLYHADRKVQSGVIEYWDDGTNAYVPVVANFATMMNGGDEDT